MSMSITNSYIYGKTVLSRFTIRRVSVLPVLFTLLILLNGCGEESTPDPIRVVDETIPYSSTWHINTILDLSDTAIISPKISFFQDNDRLHMAYYDQNPGYDETANNGNPYRVRYRAFNISDVDYLTDANTVNETVAYLDSDRSLVGLSVSVAAGNPIVAYGVYKLFIYVEGADLNNQGDVMIGIRENDATWRNEILAFGYVDPSRNPVFRDGLVRDDFSLLGDNLGNAQLCFQFYYEGIDSYNSSYPDLRYIAQPINNIADNVNLVADLEEVVEGNTYNGNGTGEQYDQGGDCDLVIDHNGNPAVFYYVDYTETGNTTDRGLRVARRISGSWQQPIWLDQDVEVVDISGAVKSDGLLAVAYTIKDGSHLFMDEDDYFVEQPLPYSIRYAEQVEVVTEVTNSQGQIEERISYEWHNETINFNSIGGMYCSLAMDLDDNPVVAYFDEMNLTETRFFSRIKVSHRTSGGIWEVAVITPEHVGLTNKTSPYDVDPGTHDMYYIGKYNYIWVDHSNRVNICSYSNITGKAYLFTER